MSSFDGVFYLSLSGAIIGFLGLCLKQIFQSKCTETSICWNMINIKRNVEMEEKLEERKIDLGIVSGSDGLQNNQSQQQIIRPISRPPSPNQRYSRQNSLIQQLQSQINSRNPSNKTLPIKPLVPTNEEV